MDERRLDEVLGQQQDAEASPADEHLRTPVTILFSDIKGSTAYFERHGDIKGMAMVERHNRLLFPCVDSHGGRIVKTIGDAIMALFVDPVDALASAADMQRVLEVDNQGKDEADQIHVRVGVHTGLGLLRENDVFGDVVNAAARVQGQAKPGQILITDSLISPAALAGFQVGKLGRTKVKGKDEPIELYALGWSGLATQQLIYDLTERADEQVQEARQKRVEVEERFDAARDQWREERRRMTGELERLEESAAEALERAREQIHDELQKQAQFKVEAAEKGRRQAEEELERGQERFESERAGLKAQILRLENRIVEAMEQVNNPARTANLIREQVQKRLEDARQEWQAQWDAERKRLAGEIERARATVPRDPMAEARRLMMERIKAKQEGRPVSEAEDLKAAREQAERVSSDLQVRVKNLENQLDRARESARQEAFEELRLKYDQRLEQAERVRVQMEQEMRSLDEQLAGARQFASSRIRQLEEAIDEAEEAARAEAASAVRSELESRLDESERQRVRLERRLQEMEEERDVDRARTSRQIQDLESSVQQAREMAFRRASEPTVEELNRLRRQLEDEFRMKAAAWEGEKARLTGKIRELEIARGSSASLDGSPHDFPS